jgi:diadenylate cyclase
VVTLRDVVAVVQRGEMVHRIADEIETMIIELGVDARLLRLQLDELYGEIDDELDLVVADYLPAGRDVEATLEEMSRLPTTTSSTCGSPRPPCTVPATPPTSTRRSPPRACGCCTGSTGCRPTWLGDRRPLRRPRQAAARHGRRPDGVDGVDETLANSIKETLERVTESTILDQYS